jgi:hypothetical protein
MSNFFSSIIEAEISIKPPITILKEFSNDLALATQGLLIGKIEKNMRYSDTSVALSFYIVAPSLNNYNYNAFRIDHDLTNPYPLEIKTSNDEFSEEPKTPEELVKSLEKIFSLPEIKGLINGLLAQVKSD